MIEEDTYVVRLTDGTFVPVVIESDIAREENVYCIQSNNSSQNIAIKVEPLTIRNGAGILADANTIDSIVTIDASLIIADRFPHTFSFNLE